MCVYHVHLSYAHIIHMCVYIGIYSSHFLITYLPVYHFSIDCVQCRIYSTFILMTVFFIFRNLNGFLKIYHCSSFISTNF